MSNVHYLLVFDHKVGRLVGEKAFADMAKALTAYRESEEAHRENDAVETVHVAADSIATVRETHANYFEEAVVTSKHLLGLIDA